MRILKTGDPCPCCGQPIQLTDPDALRLLALTADLLGLPDRAADMDLEKYGDVHVVQVDVREPEQLSMGPAVNIKEGTS